MKIAYLTAYLGKEFMERYGKGKKFALSGPLKSLGIARGMMSAGHEVVIYSPGAVSYTHLNFDSGCCDFLYVFLVLQKKFYCTQNTR